MNNEREIGVVVLSTHPIGQEGAAILRKPRGVTGLLCLPICYTPIVLASHRSVTLHYSQSHVTLSILSHYYSITQGCNAVQWHSTRDIRVHQGQGAKGSFKPLGGPGVPHSITPLLWGYFLQEHCALDICPPSRLTVHTITVTGVIPPFLTVHNFTRLPGTPRSELPDYQSTSPCLPSVCSSVYPFLI